MTWLKRSLGQATAGGLIVVSALACNGTVGSADDEIAEAEAAIQGTEDSFAMVSPCAEPCLGGRAPATPGGFIYRGGKPTRDGLRFLRDKLGVRTLINLEETPWWTGLEDVWVREVNRDPGAPALTVHSSPINPRSKPTDAQVAELLGMLASAVQTGAPVYVHCYGGRDRTGLIIALHRVLNEKWHAQAAYDEWVRFEFDRFAVLRPLYGGLFRYFEQRAGDVRRKGE